MLGRSTLSVSLSLLLAAALWLGAARSAGAQTARVFVEPPAVFNAPEVERLAPGLRAVLASRLSRPGAVVVTDKPVGGASAWVVRTTITRLGSLYSIDASIGPASGGGEPALRAFEKSDGLDGLLPALESVARRLAEAYEPPARGRSRAPAGAAAGPSDTAPRESATGRREPTPGEGPVSLAQAFRSPRTGPTVGGEAKSLAAADLDGDGDPEILVIIGAEVHAFRDRRGRIESVGKPFRPAILDPLVVSIGDPDRDGTSEVFLAGTSGTALQTQAYRWSAGGLSPKGAPVAAFVKVVLHPDRGPLLLGMLPGGGNAVFTSGLRVFVPSGDSYAAGEPFSAPEFAEILNTEWLRLTDGAPAAAVVTTENDRLRIYDSTGKRVFESADPVKGSRNLLLGPERAWDSSPGELHKAQARSLLWDSPEGARYLLLPVNQSVVGRVMPRSPSFSHGQLVAFRWDGMTLVPSGEGPKIPGFIPDLDLWPPSGAPNGGPATVYAVLVQAEGLILKKYQSKLLAYDL